MMGPYLTSRDVHKEFNNLIFDDADTVWFILFMKGGRGVPDHESVVGFCSARVTEAKAELHYDYVREQYREKKYSADMLVKIRKQYLEQNHPDLPQEAATKDKGLIERLRVIGFKTDKKRGAFTVLRKAA
jgi:hypothetical protein